MQSCFLVFGPTSHLKMTRPPDFFFFFFFRKPKLKENGVQTAKCIVESEVWGQDYKMQNTCVSKKPKYRALDGEATEYRLCKHCGCVLNTDYI